METAKATTTHGAVELALRALRRPESGMAAILSGLTADLAADLAAVYAVPVAEGEPELLASAGRDAPALGPPGPAEPEMASLLRECLFASGPVEIETPSDFPPPWSHHGHLACTPVHLPGGADVLTMVGGARAYESDALRSASAPAAMLAGAVMALRREERLRRELQASREDRALLTAGLQHDLRTPLTSIFGCAQTLRERSDVLTEEQRRELLDIVISQAKRLNEMLGESLSRAPSGPDAPTIFAESDPRSIALRVARAAKSARGGEVSVELPETPLITDERRLERALLNLVDNALKYSPADETVHIVGDVTGGIYSLTVADAGPGVASEVEASLFTPYARDPNREGSTGLGLHSAATLVEEIGGHISYARRDGWTRFTITLPTDPRERHEETEPARIVA